MTKAQVMRITTEKARANKDNGRVAEHKKYVGKLIDAKIIKSARKGRPSAQIKVGKKYSPTLTVDAFIEQGFEVIRASKNGRTILTVKW